jgi:hypothetical protein|uniref:Uncharacterized protein n=1 Tax=Populus trichocarpa TaxID=3694 RepID=A0A2K2CCD3_POPTR
MNYPADFLYQNLVAVASVSILYTLHLWACIITFQDAILLSTGGELLIILRQNRKPPLQHGSSNKKSLSNQVSQEIIEMS